jgi:hypothetical protein
VSNKFSSARYAVAECDVCGFRYMLTDLKPLTIKTKITNILACPECWNEDHPQLQLGMFPVEDPQAVRNPRPDNSYSVINQISGAGGSRVFQYGWNPVGGSQFYDSILTPNDLVSIAQVGSVTVVIT